MRDGAVQVKETNPLVHTFIVFNISAWKRRASLLSFIMGTEDSTMCFIHNSHICLCRAPSAFTSDCISRLNTFAKSINCSFLSRTYKQVNVLPVMRNKRFKVIVVWFESSVPSYATLRSCSSYSPIASRITMHF